jgi:ubiquinone/menaquinone biosynthesis C-methylase UbiE
VKDEIAENHKKYLERQALFKSFGYDVDKEREFILAAAQPISGRILEAGTGKGHFALALARAGHSFVTFDISQDEQQCAKLNIAHFGFEKHVDFRIEDGEHTSFADGEFDVIFSVNVLHHLEHAYRVLNEFIRILSPNGKIIIADFTPQGFEIVDKIHQEEGHVHSVGNVNLDQTAVYFMIQGFSVTRVQSAHQAVLVTKRGTTV